MKIVLAIHDFSKKGKASVKKILRENNLILKIFDKNYKIFDGSTKP